MDWALYLNWLRNVYQDYPYVEALATPHEIEYSELSRCNDPLLTSQMYNPAFAYYPVTGCDWIQIQNYLTWKTDRMNEYILVKTGQLAFNPGQSGDFTFNTEAYLAGQYSGRMGNLKYGKEISVPQGSITAILPHLLPGFRLPTEEEWNYASRENFRNSTTGSSFNPFGSFFYLSVFNYENRGGGHLDHVQQYVDYAGRKEPADLKRLKGANTYNTRKYGISNMGDNVKEWTMDIYSTSIKHYPDAKSVFNDNGFYASSGKEYLDVVKFKPEKDSLGRMPYRFLGLSPKGQEILVSRYGLRNGLRMMEKVPNPDSLLFKEGQKQEMRAAFIRHAEFRKKNPHEKGWVPRDTFESINAEWYANSRMFMYIPREYSVPLKDTGTHYRVIKTGTWRKPSLTSRDKMLERDAASDLGFRTVIQYDGKPVQSKYKINWR